MNARIPAVNRCLVALVLWTASLAAPAHPAVPAGIGAEARRALKKIDLSRGICVVLGLPGGPRGSSYVVDLAKGSELVIYFQGRTDVEALAVRKAAERAGLLGERVFVDQGDLKSIHLADNLADAVLVAATVRGRAPEREILRVLLPGGKAIIGAREIVKPFPEGIDDWSHPYHGPDNNPLSTDRLARAPYITQFLAEPMFCPMPAQTVSAGGRHFKAFGHLTFRTAQNAWINTLVGINGYNGTILWKRPLKDGFMVHRNTMIATPDILYLGDDESCKLIDARTGETRDEIKIPAGISDGGVFKWMGLEGGVLYALVGGREMKTATVRSTRGGLAHWGWNLVKPYDYRDPKTNFGFGRTMVAMDPKTGKVLWHHREDEYLDGRAVCMKKGRIYCYSPQKFLVCLNARNGKEVWRNSDAELLRAVAPTGGSQNPHTGFSTQVYLYCTDKVVLFAGHQRRGVVAVSAGDGKYLWRTEDCKGVVYPVLRPEALYAVTTYDKLGSGPRSGKRDYATGKVLAKLPTRWNCVRVTGSVDSLFSRGAWGAGTWRYDIASGRSEFISPMRPACQDGVIVSNGLLYWGPWMCGACNISLYGHISVGPAGKLQGRDDSRLKTGPGDATRVRSLDIKPNDWPCYGGDNRRTGATKAAVSAKRGRPWTFKPPAPGLPTAPVAAGGIVFLGDRSGVLRALRSTDGKLLWKAYTGGAIFFPPAVWKGRVYAGSADGRVYAFEAATGRELWRFRLAPVDRFIPVYGKLHSTWPVAGGVIVEGGVLYAAAGITDYDGTHVYALDAVTGKVKWHNGTSGALCTQARAGISLQGELRLDRGKLSFGAGTVYDRAEFDLKTGKCLNVPLPGWKTKALHRTVFDPYYSAYTAYPPLESDLPDGRTLVAGKWRWDFVLLAKASRKTQPGKKPNRKVLWSKRGWKLQACVAASDAALVAGSTGRGAFLAAVRIRDGSEIWRVGLPAAAVTSGAAVDHEGRVFVSLTDGRVMGFPGP